jgi:predicted peptidase
MQAGNALLNAPEIGQVNAMPVHIDVVSLETTTLAVAIVTPLNWDKARPYPAVLALPNDRQTMDYVRWCLDNYWQAEAERRGWLIISPAIPNIMTEATFFTGMEAVIPPLIEHLKQQYRIDSKQLYIGGISNGGKSAFKIALDNPQLFRGLMALAGYPPRMSDYALLSRLTGYRVALYVGEQDFNWIEPMEDAVKLLTKDQITASLTVVPNEGHEIHSLKGGVALFDVLDSWRV